MRLSLTFLIFGILILGCINAQQHPSHHPSGHRPSGHRQHNYGVTHQNNHGPTRSNTNYINNYPKDNSRYTSNPGGYNNRYTAPSRPLPYNTIQNNNNEYGTIILPPVRGPTNPTYNERPRPITPSRPVGQYPFTPEGNNSGNKIQYHRPTPPPAAARPYPYSSQNNENAIIILPPVRDVSKRPRPTPPNTTENHSIQTIPISNHHQPKPTAASRPYPYNVDNQKSITIILPPVRDPQPRQHDPPITTNTAYKPKQTTNTRVPPQRNPKYETNSEHRKPTQAPNYNRKPYVPTTPSSHPLPSIDIILPPVTPEEKKDKDVIYLPGGPYGHYVCPAPKEESFSHHNNVKPEEPYIQPHYIPYQTHQPPEKHDESSKVNYEFIMPHVEPIVYNQGHVPEVPVDVKYIQLPNGMVVPANKPHEDQLERLPMYEQPNYKHVQPSEPFNVYVPQDAHGVGYVQLPNGLVVPSNAPGISPPYAEIPPLVPRPTLDIGYVQLPDGSVLPNPNKPEVYVPPSQKYVHMQNNYPSEPLNQLDKHIPGAPPGVGYVQLKNGKVLPAKTEWNGIEPKVYVTVNTPEAEGSVKPEYPWVQPNQPAFNVPQGVNYGQYTQQQAQPRYTPANQKINPYYSPNNRNNVPQGVSYVHLPNGSVVPNNSSSNWNQQPYYMPGAAQSPRYTQNPNGSTKEYGYSYSKYEQVHGGHSGYYNNNNNNNQFPVAQGYQYGQPRYYRRLKTALPGRSKSFAPTQFVKGPHGQICKFEYFESDDNNKSHNQEG